MICQACGKEFDEYESPICEDCLRKIWHKSNETNTNEWATRFSLHRSPTLRQQKFLAQLYRGFDFDEDENCSTHKDFPGHEINLNSRECSCGKNCDASSKFKEFFQILPKDSFRTSPIIYVLKGVKDEYHRQIDISKIPIIQINSLWDPRHPAENKTNDAEETNDFFGGLRRKFFGEKASGSNQKHVEWPHYVHYTCSIAKKEKSFESERFKNADFEWKIPNARLLSNAGQFTFVLPCKIEGEKKAIRLFTEKKPDITQRYGQLSQFFEEHSIIEKIPELVDFDFHIDEINVRTKSDSGPTSGKYPLVEMDWVDGISLDEFILENFQNSSKLSDMADQFSEFIEKLESNEIGHGDLHPKNIIIDSNQKMKVIDYDCFYIPDFKGDESPESGHSDFQHPSRLKKGNNFPKYDETIDRFSSIVIYLSLLIISKEPKIYDEKNSENILFSEEIFDSLRDGKVPNLIENIESISDEKIKILMKHLLEYIKLDSPQIKSLTEINKNV
jgi:hypothetical protein